MNTLRLSSGECPASVSGEHADPSSRKHSPRTTKKQPGENRKIARRGVPRHPKTTGRFQFKVSHVMNKKIKPAAQSEPASFERTRTIKYIKNLNTVKTLVTHDAISQSAFNKNNLMQTTIIITLHISTLSKQYNFHPQFGRRKHSPCNQKCQNKTQPDTRKRQNTITFDCFQGNHPQLDTRVPFHANDLRVNNPKTAYA